MTLPIARPPRQRGVTLIEILVTVLILAFGMLGLIGMNVKVQTSQSEAYQRAQAILLVQDMANRIAANRSADAQNYVTGATPLGTNYTDPTTCSGTGSTLDKCEWSKLLKGAAEQVNGNNGAACSTASGNCQGAMVGARGCITRTTVSSAVVVYQVTVAWQGTTDLGTPSLSCGSGSYERETLRRAISANVTLSCLTAPTTACAF